jgi:hypothetical protein
MVLNTRNMHGHARTESRHSFLIAKERTIHAVIRARSIGSSMVSVVSVQTPNQLVLLPPHARGGGWLQASF